ncbi:hypothetical protein [Parendozoicomonas haliclonae]|uniref:DUF1795 domain-containing protein n=1 Tax=Parendozoicomonas haliclonae TaxID=1960125 RepID=A0A1X7AI07_9GAMM|nr:hypothetical protein [Parendozoicomonas haliclonae]SMA42910.1 hypothetical protein EHSB41UT_01524 [Parendozoicomonas haliclonae]
MTQSLPARCLPVLFLLSLIGSFAGANDLAPPGYSWQACKSIECYFLVPDGWQLKQLDNAKVLKYQLMPDQHNRKVPPQIRINILTNMEGQTGLSAERHTELFMQELGRNGKVLDIWNHKSGVLRSTAATSLHVERVPAALRKFNLLIRNTQTGTLYVFTFETQSEYWDKDWGVVEAIFTRLRLDEGV